MKKIVLFLICVTMFAFGADDCETLENHRTTLNNWAQNRQQQMQAIIDAWGNVQSSWPAHVRSNYNRYQNERDAAYATMNDVDTAMENLGCWDEDEGSGGSGEGL